MQSLMFIFLACLGTSTAFYFANVKVDCQVSQWSTWAGPVGFGEYVRSRTILAYPVNGGKSCPLVTETKSAGRPPTVKETAKVLIENFLRRKSQSPRSKRTPDNVRDLLILMDSSGSITKTKFTQALNDLADLLGLLCPLDPFNSTNHHAALIQFSGAPKEEFFFGQYLPTEILKKAIKNIKYMDGSTCTGSAFIAALNMFRSSQKGVRNSPYVDKEVLILTDGLSNCGPNATQAANDLKAATFPLNAGTVQVYGLLVGPFDPQGQAEVRQYVSSPANMHLFNVPSFDDLARLLAETKTLTATYPKCAAIEIPPPSSG